jgi:hypothetical protein
MSVLPYEMYSKIKQTPHANRDKIYLLNAQLGLNFLHRNKLLPEPEDHQRLVTSIKALQEFCNYE